MSGRQAGGEYRIYGDLATWWPMISPPREYTQEVAYLAELLRRTAAPREPGGELEVLDLGSGGGHVAAHLTDGFSVTLVDISAEMLETSEKLNPGRPHVQGDMRTVRLGRTFDAVLVHDAIDYIIGRPDLDLVVKNAARHCRAGGIALFVPDYLKDTFAELTGAGGGGVDANGRTASFTERTWDPDPDDDWVQADYEFTLTEADGSIEVITESHRLSAFSRDVWTAALSGAGFAPLPEPRIAAGQRPGNLFTGRRPAA